MFWRGVLGYLPAQLVQALAGFGAVWAFTRLLTPEEYGQYALAFTASALLHSALITWTQAAMERFTLAESERGDLPSHLVTLHGAFAAFAAAAGVLTAAALVLLRLDPALETAIAWATAAAVLRGGLNLVQLRRKAEGRVLPYVVNDMLVTGGGFAVGVLLARLGWGGAAPAAGIAACATLLLLVSGLPEIRRGRGGRFEGERAGRYLRYGLPISAGLVLAVVIAGTDRVLIAAFLDEASAGAYHAGHGLAHRMLDILFIWLGLAGAPAIIAALERDGPAAMAAAAREQAELMMLVTVPAAVGLALVARPLAEIMVGAELRPEATRVIPWIAAGAWFLGFRSYYLDQAFTLGRRSSQLIVSVLVPAVLNVLLNLLLIPPLGLDGAMVATTVSLAAGALASYALGSRVMRLPLPWTTFGRCGAAAAAMAAAVSLVPALGGAPELLLKAAVGAAVFGAAAFALDAAGARSRLRKLRARRAAQVQPDPV